MKTGGINNIVMSAYNNLTSTNNAIEKTARALSTGLRTATAADDASGFAMGLKMSSQIAGVDRAIRNSQDGVSLLQTAEGGLNEINSMLQRMRELTLEAATDTLTTQDRNYIQHEIGELRKAIDSTAASTTFNNKRLLDGSSAVEWSSDNSNISVKASGALTVTDKFGQKKRIEGNYKIEVKAKPGQAEIKKTNIFDVTRAKEIYRTEIASDGTEVQVRDVEIVPSTLGDMTAFTDATGKSMFSQPQTITITQGDGQTTEITLYSSDTIDNVREKINNAIANDLGQGQYTDNVNNFCTISDGTPGLEAVYEEEKVYRPVYERDENDELVLDDSGYPVETGEIEIAGYTTQAAMIIRSVIPGTEGRLTFTSDNQDLVNALGLVNIKDAVDSEFTSSVYDAHSGTTIAKNVSLSGNTLEGVISENLKFEFNAMTNIKASWSESTKTYVLNADSQPEVMKIHIKDKSTAFQVGQNIGE
ncbi:MAG: hypothetical protein IJL01_08420, partial [Synergistaceae bacterium]|nr:hypothetical protein [Synergistaceae bacterium]